MYAAVFGCMVADAVMVSRSASLIERDASEPDAQIDALDFVLCLYTSHFFAIPVNTKACRTTIMTLNTVHHMHTLLLLLLLQPLLH